MGCIYSESSTTKDDIKPNMPNNLIPEHIIDKLRQTTIRIKLGNKNLTGFFLKINIEEKSHVLIITSAHSITKENINSKKTISIFYGKQEIETKIKLDDNKRLIKCFIDDDIDATIIEILPEDKIPGDKYMYPDLNYKIGYEQFINKDIYTGYYSNIDKNKFDIFYFKGKIKGFQDKNNYQNFIYDCVIKNGISGSPLIDNNKRVIGINFQNNDNNNSLNYGVFIGVIIDKLNQKKQENKIVSQEKISGIDNKDDIKPEEKINGRKDDEEIDSKNGKLNVDDEKKTDYQNNNNEEKNEEINFKKENESKIDKNINEKLNNIVINNENEGGKNLDINKLNEKINEEENEKEKIIRNNPGNDEIIDISSKNVENKDEEHLKNPEIQMMEIFLTNPYFLNFFKSMFHDPKMNQHIKNSETMKEIKEKDPEFAELLDDQEIIDKLFTPEVGHALVQDFERLMNKKKIDNDNNKNEIDKLINQFNDKIKYFYTYPEIYQENLKEMKGMGFEDETRIKLALIICDGNLEKAINYLTVIQKKNENNEEDEK